MHTRREGYAYARWRDTLPAVRVDTRDRTCIEQSGQSL